MTPLLIASVAIMLASLSGKLLIWRGAGNYIERNLHVLVTFSAGVFLVFALQLAREVFEHMDVMTGLLWMIGGAIGITLVCKALPHGGHDHAAHHGHHHSHLDPHRMLISDSIHNTGDGILLAAAFSLSPVIGFATAVSVFLHEVAQEIAEFFVLRDAGYSTRKALILNFATSATMLIGAVGGYLVLDIFESFEGPLLAIAAGGVFSVVFYELLPHSYRYARSNTLLSKHLLWLLLGVLVMVTMSTLLPHQDHGHSESDIHDAETVYDLHE